MGTPISKNARVALQNVGCKLNAYEVEALAHRLTERGYSVVPFNSEADVYVVNTCTVTGAGDADSRKAVRRARRRNPSAEIVATGCYAQRRPADLAAAGADLVVGNGQKAQLVELLEAHLAGAETPRPRRRGRALSNFSPLTAQCPKAARAVACKSKTAATNTAPIASSQRCAGTVPAAQPPKSSPKPSAWSRPATANSP